MSNIDRVRPKVSELLLPHMHCCTRSHCLQRTCSVTGEFFHNVEPCSRRHCATVLTCMSELPHVCGLQRGYATGWMLLECVDIPSELMHRQSDDGSR